MAHPLQFIRDQQTPQMAGGPHGGGGGGGHHGGGHHHGGHGHHGRGHGWNWGGGGWWGPWGWDWPYDYWPSYGTIGFLDENGDEWFPVGNNAMGQPLWQNSNTGEIAVPSSVQDATLFR